jgi:hypothetical protein
MRIKGSAALLLSFLMPMLPRTVWAANGPETSSELEVRTEFARWTEAYKAHDLEGTMAIFDPAVKLAFQGGPDADFAQLRKAYEKEFQSKSAAEWVGAIDEVIVSDGMAAEFSTWKLVDPAGKVLENNRGMDLLRRNSHGKWRIIRSLNYPVVKKAPETP